MAVEKPRENRSKGERGELVVAATVKTTVATIERPVSAAMASGVV
jgi:hypothetical protein